MSSYQVELPALDEAWLAGDEGHYYSEFIVPVVRRPPAVDAVRRLKTSLRAALGSPNAWLAGKPLASTIERAIARRGEDVAVATSRLHALSAEGALDQPLTALWSSYTHLHLNRLGAAASESSLLGLLHRTRAGLAKAPAARPGDDGQLRRGDDHAKSMADGGPDGGVARRRDRE